MLGAGHFTELETPSQLGALLNKYKKTELATFFNVDFRNQVKEILKHPKLKEFFHKDHLVLQPFDGLPLNLQKEKFPQIREALNELADKVTKQELEFKQSQAIIIRAVQGEQQEAAAERKEEKTKQDEKNTPLESMELEQEQKLGREIVQEQQGSVGEEDWVDDAPDLNVENPGPQQRSDKDEEGENSAMHAANPRKRKASDAGVTSGKRTRYTLPPTSHLRRFKDSDLIVICPTKNNDARLKIQSAVIAYNEKRESREQHLFVQKYTIHGLEYSIVTKKHETKDKFFPDSQFLARQLSGEREANKEINAFWDEMYPDAKLLESLKLLSDERLTNFEEYLKKEREELLLTDDQRFAMRVQRFALRAANGIVVFDASPVGKEANKLSLSKEVQQKYNSWLEQQKNLGKINKTELLKCAKFTISRSRRPKLVYVALLPDDELTFLNNLGDKGKKAEVVNFGKEVIDFFLKDLKGLKDIDSTFESLARLPAEDLKIINTRLQKRRKGLLLEVAKSKSVTHSASKGVLPVSLAQLGELSVAQSPKGDEKAANKWQEFSASVASPMQSVPVAALAESAAEQAKTDKTEEALESHSLAGPSLPVPAI